MHFLCARKRPRAGSLLRRQRAAGLGEWQDVNGTISRLPRLLIRIILLSLLALLKYFERFSQRMRAIVVAAIARFKMLSMCLSIQFQPGGTSMVHLVRVQISSAG